MSDSLSLTEWVSSRARQRARSSTFIVSESLFAIRSQAWRILLAYTRVHFQSQSQHTTPGDTHANLSRLKANLSWPIRKSAGRSSDERARITTLCVWQCLYVCVCVCDSSLFKHKSASGQGNFGTSLSDDFVSYWRPLHKTPTPIFAIVATGSHCNHADPLKAFFFILELKSYCTEYMHAFLDGLNENTVFSKCTR